MAIFRCNKCAHLQELADLQVGQTVACPRCDNPAPVYNTLFFVGKLLERYFDAQREILNVKVAPATRESPLSRIWERGGGEGNGHDFHDRGYLAKS